MVDRKQLEDLVGKLNGLNFYTWLETDREGRVEGVGSQLFYGQVYSPLVAAEKMRKYLAG